MTNKASALVIGCNGGIGRALTAILYSSGEYSSVHGIGRKKVTTEVPHVRYHQVSSEDEEQIAQFCQRHRQQFSTVICCIGTLHQADSEVELYPEKRLEDLQADKLAEYFRINTVIPSLWIKHGISLLSQKTTNHLVFLSARVGSIADNRLGGWYGYRASKSALNMMIKTAHAEYSRRSPDTVLVAYHPGTVDTGLSEPFQARVAADKLFTPEFTARQLLAMLPTLSAVQGPHFIDWQGKPIPW